MLLAALREGLLLTIGLLAGYGLARTPLSTHRFAPAIAAGGLFGFQVFCLLPGSIPLISTIILVPAFTLGIISGVFLKEGNCRRAEMPGIVLMVHTFCLGLNLAPLPVPLSGYFVCIGFLCARTPLWWTAPLVLMGGVLAGGWWMPSARLSGMMLAISCGLLLQTAPRAPLSAPWLGGLAAALMLSTF